VSHREVFSGGKSLNRMREEVLRYHSVSVAPIAFQACSFNRVCLAFSMASLFSNLRASAGTSPFEIVSDRQILSDHL
jgi:hypothetical protein